MLRYLSLVLKNSLRNRRRSVLTIASVSASLCLLGVLMAIYRVLFFGGDSTPAQALRLITHHKVSLAQSLPSAYVRHIQQVPGVKAATAWQWFGGAYRDAQDPRNFFARFGVDPVQMFRVWPEYLIPEDQRLAFERQRTACVTSRTLANKFGWRLGERITLAGDSFPVLLDLILVGIFDGAENSEVLYLNYDYLRESLPAGSARRDMVSQVIVRVESPDDAPQVAEEIDALFENSPDPTTTESERLFLLNFISFLGNFQLFLAAICGAVTFTILLVSGNTLSMSVRERVREVGILKTLGFTPAAILGFSRGRILVSFLIESLLLSLTGGLLGCLLALPLNHFRTGVGSMITFSEIAFEFRVDLAAMLAGIAFALLMGALGGFFPARAAARREIVNALREV